MKLSVEARAKLNLGLRITGRRQDGFHDIRSVFQEITLADRLDITINPGRGRISLICSGDPVPGDSSNLAWKAAELFLELSGESIDVHIDLTKLIPSEAGLGGGSSDGAAVLLALREMTGRQDLDLSKVAERLGSDVPFFISGGCALVEGRGETVTPIDPIPFHAVLLHSTVRVSTAWAYDQWDTHDMSLTFNGVFEHYSASSAVWHEGKPFPHDLRNDFLPLLKRNFPEIEELTAFLEGSCDNWGLSGSGPTLFALFRTERESESFSRKLTGKYSLCSTAEAAGASSNG